MAGYDEDVFGAPAGNAGFDAEIFKTLPARKEVLQKSSSAPVERFGDAGNAVGTGFMNGLARLAGLPADTAANVLDLGKAALGTPYISITGKSPPEWLDVGGRSNVFGSGDNIIKNASNTQLGRALLKPQNPEYSGGYLQAIGGGMTGIINPLSGRQALNQGINSVLGAVASKATYDATGSTALAIAAGMSPTAIQSGAIDASKYLVRGGEAGRANMAQRIQDLKDAGINQPTLGLSSGNSTLGGIENLLQSTPGAVGLMRRNRDAALAGLDAKAMGAADLASRNRGAMESGRSIQSGAKAFKDNSKLTQAALYDGLDKFIPGQTPVNVGNTKSILSQLNADIPGAPALSRQFKNARIAAIEDAIRSDTQGTAPGSALTIQGGGGMMNAPIVTGRTGIPGGSSTDSLPFEAVKKTRTLVGGEIADNSMMSDVPRSKWNPLYGALSQDMQGAATAAGPDAARTFNRASDYTRSSIGRMERIAPIIDRAAPEQSFSALSNTLKENTSTFQAVKKSLPEGARGDFAGTVVERLGKAKSGQQNDLGDKWSPETFLSNWNNMKPQARAELFSGFKNSEQVASDVASVAKATAMMRDNSKMWANPSGTAANSFARGTIGAIAGGGAGAAAGLLSPMIPLGALAGVGGVNLMARGLLSPTVRNSMASKSYIDPQMLNAQVNSLIGSGLLNYGE